LRRSAVLAQRKARLEARAGVLKALAHPTRLFIVEELEKGERYVCDLTAMIGADVSTVSKHLAVLKQAGIVADDKRGNQVFYRLRVPCILNFFGCVESVLETRVKEKAACLTAIGR
jgi:DNA-binding transcriptional ArsR family regulator